MRLLKWFEKWWHGIEVSRSLFAVALPGIQKLIEQEKCEFYWNGFVATCKYDNHFREISVDEIERLMRADNYTAIKHYVISLCRECKDATS